MGEINCRKEEIFKMIQPKIINGISSIKKRKKERKKERVNEEMNEKFKESQNYIDSMNVKIVNEQQKFMCINRKKERKKVRKKEWLSGLKKERGGIDIRNGKCMQKKKEKEKESIYQRFGKR